MRTLAAIAGTAVAGAAGAGVALTGGAALHQTGTAFVCDNGDDRVPGGAGVDPTVGEGGGDLLNGGPGDDPGDGGTGADRCVAVETRISCELSPAGGRRRGLTPRRRAPGSRGPWC